MRLNKPYFACVCAFFLAMATSWAGEPSSISLHLRLIDIAKHSAPEVFEGDTLIFTASGGHRSVSVAFAHEGWGILHPFRRTENGVFVCVVPVPRQRIPRTAGAKSRAEKTAAEKNLPVILEELEYRYVIDGVWTNDVANPRRKVDARTGMSVSVVGIPVIPAEGAGKYSVLEADGRTACFLFRGEPGETVTVAGSFNGWDPYLYELEETESGVYSLELTLPPGTHYYTFVYLGERIPDPLNDQSAWTAQGAKVSVLRVGSTR